MHRKVEAGGTHQLPQEAAHAAVAHCQDTGALRRGAENLAGQPRLDDAVDFQVVRPAFGCLRFGGLGVGALAPGGRCGFNLGRN